MAKYSVLKNRGEARLTASEKLTAEDFDAISASLGQAIRQARKVSLVTARIVRQSEKHQTVWESEKTVASAEPGDWIVTNLGRDRQPLIDSEGRINTYVIQGARFPELYKRVSGETPHGPLFSAKQEAMVDTLFFSGGLDIAAPWGERQTIAAGYLLRNGTDVYGNERQAFERTYDLT